MKSSFTRSFKSGTNKTSRSSLNNETHEVVNPLIAGLSLIEDDEDSYDEDMYKKWQKRLNYNLNIKKKAADEEVEVSDEEKNMYEHYRQDFFKEDMA